MKALAVLPEVTVSIGGSPFSASDARGLAEITVRQRLSMPTQCELVFFDPPGPLPTLTSVAPGSSVRIDVVGFDNALFTGEVTAIEQCYNADRGREVRVRAYDPMHRLRKRHKVQTHVDVTARSLAEELVADAGLSVEAEDDGPQWKMLVQDRQSDLELLGEALDRCGLHYVLREDTLHLISLKGIGEPLDLRLGDTLLEATIQANGDPACRSVAVSGWDALTAAPHSGDAANGRVAWSPSDALEPGKLGGDGTLYLINEGLASDRHAEAVAAAELDSRVGGEATLEAVAEGSPALRPGTVVKIVGATDPIADQFALTEVDHEIRLGSGFISSLRSRPPLPGRRPQTTATTIGVVTRVDDPESKGRVKVRLPSIGDLETDWMEVVAIAAGSGKGLVALPDVHDTVLVLLPFQDPAAGLVLGGLYGDHGAPIKGGVDGGAVRVFSLITQGGMKLTFDDTHKRIRLEDGGGSYLELTRQRVTLHSATNLEISAPGKQIKVRAAAVEFETA